MSKAAASATPHDVVILGAGANGLVAAATLARAGLRTLVLERNDIVGGCAVTTELAPGYKCPALAHRAAIAPEVLSTLDLAVHGLQAIRPDVRACGVAGGGALALPANQAAAAKEIASFSTRDADVYVRFLESVRAVTAVIRGLLDAPPPDPGDVSFADLVGLLRTSRQFRALGKPDAYRLLRWLPMPVADFASEWFESEPLRAVVAADGLLGGFAGPRSAGTTAVFLLRAATDVSPVAPGWTARGGPGAIIAALAAAAAGAGAEIRTGADVEGVTVRDGRTTGVMLATGEEIAATTVVSSLDPKRTLLGLVDPRHVPPTFIHHVEHVRTRGALAKVNFAVEALPRFTSLAGRPLPEQRAILSGCVRLAADTDTMERAFDAAKYGRTSDLPWVELTVPSAADSSLAPLDGHVVSAYVQFAPYSLRGSNWDAERERLGDLVSRTIDDAAPGFATTIIAREVITPLDLETRVGLTGGQIFHGELALDQLFFSRPAPGWSRYKTPIRGLYLCGSGTHPGTGLDGRSGLLAARRIIADRRRT